MKKRIMVLLVVVLLFTGGLLSFQLGIWPATGLTADKVETGTSVGQKAPDFTLQRLNGEEISLSDLQGKKVFLNFWASWCPPCKSEMPEIEKLYLNHNKVAVLGVNLQEKKGVAAEFMMRNNYSFPVVLDKNADVAFDYLVRGIPTTYILDENGIITAKHVGPLSYSQMLDLLDLKE